MPHFCACHTLPRPSTLSVEIPYSGIAPHPTKDTLTLSSAERRLAIRQLPDEGNLIYVIPGSEYYMRSSPPSALLISASHSRQQSPNGRRSQYRFAIALNVEYKVDGGERKIGRAVNLSSKGILFKATDRVRVGKRIELFIAWPMKLDGNVALTLWVTGDVVRTGQHIAVHLSKHEFRTARVRTSSSI